MSPIKIGIQIVPQFGDMSVMRDRWMEAEDLGADVIYTCDHFFPMEFSESVASGAVHAKQPDNKNFEATTIQAAMAATTSRVEIGCIVHANSYRNPNLMADIARTIDHISGGRFILGIGSGYQRRDYEEYGYEYGTTKSRLLDLKRDIPIMKARFEKLNPKPLRKIPIMIASMGEQIGMRIVAEHADMWHVYGHKDQVTHKTAVLKELCQEIGRDFNSIELTTFFMPHLLGESEGDPEVYLKLGIRHLIYINQGPDWDMSGFRKLLAWRKAATGA
ncbi:MAG: LLM class F420-dependent oxidoreductase [Steroidobacteraceae bacterium]